MPNTISVNEGITCYNKLLIVALDGATFKVLNPALEDGNVPTIQSLINQGVSGELESVVPPLSTYAWPTIYTGVNAGKSGVFAMSPVNCKNNLLEIESGLINSTKVRSISLWKILSEHGKRVGVVNIPVTYPPEQVNGFIISGFLTPSQDRGYFYPAELEESLKEYQIDIKFGNRLGLIPDGNINKAEVLKQQYMVSERRFETCVRLIQKWQPDFFIVNFKGVDVIQHLFWHQQEVIYEFLRKVDNYISHLIEVMNPDATLIISDHGFHSRSEKYFHINTWLLKNGYLDSNTSASGKLQIGLYNVGSKLINRFDFIRNLIPESFKGKVMTTEKVAKQIDWEGTTAFGTRWALYINNSLVNKDREYEALLEELIIELRAATCPYTGKKIFQQVLPRPEVFSGPFLQDLPDIVLLPTPDYKINPNLHKEIITPRKDAANKTGDHNADPVGILIAVGKDICSDRQIQGCSIMDLVPTILYMMDIPIPVEMDGRVLKDLFFQDSHLYQNEIKYQESTQVEQKTFEISEKDEAEIKERLKGLGYLS